MATQFQTVQPREPQSIVTTVAERYGMAAGRFVQALRATVVPSECDDAQLAAFLVVCNEYKLNPLTKEIYAFPSKGRVTPMVSIDGWVSLINRHPAMDGMEFQDIPDATGKLLAIECTIYRKDRSRPIKVIEYLAECKGTTGPWTKSPARMLRHRALIQAGRYAFGFSGVAVEGDMIEGGAIEPQMHDVTPPRRSLAIEADNAQAAEFEPVTDEAAKREPARDYAAADALFAAADDDDDETHDPETGEVAATVEQPTPDAQKWADVTLGFIAKAADRAALAGLQQRRADKLVELRAALPDLAATVDAAYAAKLAAFDAEDGE